VARAGNLLLLLISLLLLRGSSCLRVDRPYTTPTAQEVIAALKQRAARLNTMRGETRMNHHTDQGKVKATVRFMAQRGGRLRFDAVSPFDTPLATLVTDGKRFALVDAQKNRHYHGSASACNLARLLQVALEPDDILVVFGGSTPLIQHDSATLEWDSRATAEVLTLKSATMTQTVRLDGTARRWDLLSSEIHNARGELLLQIKPAGYHRVSSLSLPTSLLVRQPRNNNARLEIGFQRQEVNIKLPAAAFELPAPDGMPSQQVECTTVVKP